MEGCLPPERGQETGETQDETKVRLAGVMLPEDWRSWYGTILPESETQEGLEKLPVPEETISGIVARMREEHRRVRMAQVRQMTETKIPRAMIEEVKASWREWHEVELTPLEVVGLSGAINGELPTSCVWLWRFVREVGASIWKRVGGIGREGERERR